jgi:acyl-CoA thioesterase-1
MQLRFSIVARMEKTSLRILRFDKSVSVEHPDLVLWQVGTNWLLQDRPLDESHSLVIEGLGRIQSIGAEVVLVDTQYAPELLLKSNYSALIDLLAAIGRQFRVSVFRRSLIMQHWHISWEYRSINSCRQIIYT